MKIILLSHLALEVVMTSYGFTLRKKFKVHFHLVAVAYSHTKVDIVILQIIGQNRPLSTVVFGH